MAPRSHEKPSARSEADAAVVSYLQRLLEADLSSRVRAEVQEQLRLYGIRQPQVA
ncbi:hypothetical protein OVA21_16560 [Dietzia sp. SL131]|uniref:hypothetical protein n=1 Tax=Dietzia sp. SL131 TaxID=2995149 RepID=UPI00227BD034|nr:hypothetical protein [Dietzia sp. SL131]MCY1658784.1 hypothetical protein [Dietzia sp. SL131]